MNRTALFLAAALTAAAPAAFAQSPAESFPEVSIPGGTLKGTMLAPAAGKGPVALIIPGSGPTDRDGNSPLGIKASSYRLLAEGLAARGVTTVRIDKRGMFASTGPGLDANAVTIPDYAADVAAWIAEARRRTGAGCVWLLGHSEGGLVALAAAQSDPSSDPSSVCGLVLAATPGHRMGDVLRAQFKANPANAPLLDQALPAIEALEDGRAVDVGAFHPALKAMFAPVVQKYLMSVFSYDPAELLRASAKPVLILQGTSDIQVGTADAQRLKEAQPAAELALLPDVNHVLKTVPPGDLTANVATYADPGLPLAPDVVERIAAFVGRGG